jgi:type VI secretion system protein ImpM
MAAVGLLGKLPSHGDFLRRGVPAGLAAPLDHWLAAALAHSRDALGEGWLAAFLEAPVWRFALAAGACGAHAAAGVWLPSVDRVGRYFPLVLVAALDGAPPPSALLRDAGAWYDGLEELALSLLDGRLGPEALEARLALHPPPFLPSPGPMPWRLEPGEVAAWRLAALAPVGSLWWGKGSPRVPPGVLACAGLPPPEAFAAMLDGGFAGHGWTELAA